MLKHLERLSRVIKYGVAAILLAVPLYPKFPFIRIPGTYVSIRLEDFLIAIVSLLVLVFLFPKIKEIVRGRVEQAIFLFLFVSVVSVISGVFLTQTIPLHLGILHWTRRVEYFAPFFIAMALIKGRDPNLIEFIIKVLMLTIFIAFIYGYGQIHSGWPVIITQNEEYSKGIALRWVPGSQLSSTFAGHYDLATFLIFVLPVFITTFFLIRGLFSKIALGGTIFCGLWLLVNTLSRTSILAYFISSSLSLFLAKKYKAIPVVLAVSLIFFGFSSNLLARYIKLLDVVRIQKILYITPYAFAEDMVIPERRSVATPTASPTPVFEDRSTSIRLKVEWPRAVRAFSKNPLLGTGFSSITLATDNDYLRLLGEVGILGFLSFILIFLNIGMIVKKTLAVLNRFSGVEMGLTAGVIGAVPGVLLNAFFIDVFEASKFAIIFWLLVGISVSLLKMSKNEQTN